MNKSREPSRTPQDKRGERIPRDDPAEVLDNLMSRRVIIVLGKGGVGRTTVCASLAELAHHREMRTLVMETDTRTPIAAAYGKTPGFKPEQLATNLFAMLLDRQQSVEEYLGFVVSGPILHAVFASSLYQCFIHAAPALRELMMMGKIFHESERRSASLTPWDLVIVDMPASGQALAMIGMPFAARETFGDNVVGHEAEAVANFFRDRSKCAMLTVATAEPLAMVEAVEISRKLEATGLANEAIIFNRLSRARFADADLAALKQIASLDPKCVYNLAQIARSELNRRNRERRASSMLRRMIGAPLLNLPDVLAQSGLPLAAHLADQLDGLQAASE